MTSLTKTEDVFELQKKREESHLKRVLSCLLVLIYLLVFAGCSESNQDSESETLASSSQVVSNGEAVENDSEAHEEETGLTDESSDSSDSNREREENQENPSSESDENEGNQESEEGNPSDGSSSEENDSSDVSSDSEEAISENANAVSATTAKAGNNSEKGTTQATTKTSSGSANTTTATKSTTKAASTTTTAKKTKNDWNMSSDWSGSTYQDLCKKTVSYINQLRKAKGLSEVTGMYDGKMAKVASLSAQYYGGNLKLSSYESQFKAIRLGIWCVMSSGEDYYYGDFYAPACEGTFTASTVMSADEIVKKSIDTFASDSSAGTLPWLGDIYLQSLDAVGVGYYFSGEEWCCYLLMYAPGEGGALDEVTGIIVDNSTGKTLSSTGMTFTRSQLDSWTIIINEIEWKNSSEYVYMTITK